MVNPLVLAIFLALFLSCYMAYTITNFMLIVKFLFLRITAMALVWQYGEVSGYESWKGLSWGMVSYFL